MNARAARASIRVALAALVLLGCAQRTYGPGVALEPVRIPGMWAPSAETLAIGDRQTVRYEGSPRISDGGYCTSDNPWRCSCVHPACSRGLPGTLELARYLRRRFTQITSAGGFDCCRQNTGSPSYLSVHSIGRAIDLMIPTISGDADNTAGDPVAAWLVEHAQEIGVQYVAWDRAQWSPSRSPGSRLRPYTGPIPHVDHIHMELNLAGANRRTPFFTSGASTRPTTCAPRCDGDLVVAMDCATTDCAAHGTTCIADPSPRCVTPGCPPTGSATVCLDDAHVLACENGVARGGPADCGVFAAFCSSAGVAPTAARCVSAFCASGPTEVPTPHQTCSLTPGAILDCDVNGAARDVPCSDAEVCSMLGGSAHCEPARSECPRGEAGPPLDERTVCLSTGELARCVEGNVVSGEPCEAGSVCSTVGGTAHCASAACILPDGTVAYGEVCTPSGDLATCDELGGIASLRPCADGEVCVSVGGRATCTPGVRPDPRGMEDLPGVSDDAELPDGGLGRGGWTGVRGRILQDTDCSCRVPGASRRPVGARSFVLALALLATLGHRRRRAAQQSSSTTSGAPGGP